MPLAENSCKPVVNHLTEHSFGSLVKNSFLLLSVAEQWPLFPFQISTLLQFSARIMLIRFYFLLLVAQVSWNNCEYILLCPQCSYVRYRIKYFSWRCLYYSNTTSSYCPSALNVDISGDVEKNPGPRESGGEELPTSSNGSGRERSNTTSIATHGASRRGIPATECSPFDVGLYAFPNARRLTNDQKYDLILKCWNPDPSYSFPKTAEGKKMSQRSFRHEWLRIYPWLRYSRMYDGAFCLPCILFGNNSEKLDKLFKSPLILWTSAVSKFAAHQTHSRMHKHSVQDLQIFKVSMQRQRSLDIDQQLLVQRARRIQENREKLAPILKCVIYCGQTNQGLRGHRDDSKATREFQSLGRF